MTDMLRKIENLMENINRSIEWIRKNKPELFSQRFVSLIEERRKLRILVSAERNNPSIAAFGQSQVGKSYLMNCILQNGDSPFLVEAPGKSYNFVDEINPIGEGQESTGVVTRFTSYNRNKDAYCPEYPIRMRVLSMKDMINVISDTYFNEFDDYTTLGEKKINDFCEILKERYANSLPQPSPVLNADDLLDMKYYFKKHINNASVYVKTPFFDTLALLIDRIPLSDYKDIFSKLWYNEETDEPNKAYTDIFDRALDILRRLNFNEYVYLPIEAVLHKGRKEDTIMSVSCLKLLFTKNEKAYKTTAAHFSNGETAVLDTFTKSELCMVCSEVVIKIDERFIATSGSFDFTMMSESSQRKLPGENVRLEVLKTTDLLDFPGARARGNMRLSQIETDHDNLMYTLLRGKVAYLFNKYNEEKNINILLFCHNHKNVETPQMWQLLDEWVREYVGKTPEERSDYIKGIGISPLFHIGTMFNLSLQNPDAETGKTDEGIRSRWAGRFKEKLIDECFKKADWVFNWDGIGKPFQNCHMLRDYKFSTNIYSGWDIDGKEKELIIKKDYYKRLRELFIESNRDYQLFADAELAWDVSSTRNNDGALYILYLLAQLSAKIDAARESQIAEHFSNCRETVHSIMREYYQSTEKDKIIEENTLRAKSIRRELDFTCNNDNYYFGHLLQALQMEVIDCYKVVHEVLQSNELNKTVDTFNEYEIIRKRCRLGQIEGEDEKWESIMKVYGLEEKDAAERFLVSKNVDVKKLFSGSYRKKLNSYVIAGEMLEKWLSNIKSEAFLNEFCSEGGFDAVVMSNLITEYVTVAESLLLEEKMAEAIAEYVDVIDVHTANEGLLADILATVINTFVLDFGYSWLPDDVRKNAREVFESDGTLDFNYIDNEQPASVSDEELVAMFDRMSKNNDLLSSFYDNSNKWLDYMFISFVANQEIPKFDREANNALEKLLADIRQ